MPRQPDAGDVFGQATSDLHVDHRQRNRDPQPAVEHIELARWADVVVVADLVDL